jgi:hypothetical protein
MLHTKFKQVGVDLILPGEEGPGPGLVFQFYDSDSKQAFIGGTSSPEKDWGSMYTSSAMGPGFCLRFSVYDIKQPVAIKYKPNQAVVNLHVQASNDAYCSLGKMADDILLKEDYCQLFVQGEETFKSYLLPGNHIQMDCLFAARFLESFSEVEPAIKPYLDQLLVNKTSFPGAGPVKASSRMEELVKEISEYTHESKPAVSFFRTRAMEMLRECLY